MNWEIIAGLITISGFLIAIGKIIANNTKALTEVKEAIKNIKETSDETRSEIKKLQDGLNDHETRITVLEKKEEQ